MNPVLLIGVLVTGGLLAWVGERRGTDWPRWISLFALGIDLVLASALAVHSTDEVALTGGGAWLAEVRWAWIPDWGIGFHLAVDGLSLVLVLLTLFLGILSVGASWTEIRARVGFFHFNLLWVLAGVLGVFLALDLFLFYFFWELMLVPMYFLIAIWGHENRAYAAIKFFLFTQASGLLMLVAILGLVFVHHGASGVYSFESSDLLGTAMRPATAMWLFLGFVVAFAVKLPAVPLHTWLPDAHTEAPTAGSVVLAGLLLKTGAYGLLRFALPLFPAAAHAFAPTGMVVGVVGILYGAILAFAQDDLKRLVAYTSVSHMGFVLLGIFAGNGLALQGVVMQMLCHGISTGALFILVGALQERIHTRDLGRMGGLWAAMPRMGGAATLFALASLGLPGLGNFVAEFLILLGTYRVSPALAVLASLGLVAATLYALRLIQRAFHGPRLGREPLRDLAVRDMAILTAMIAAILWLGLYPQPVLDTAAPALQRAQTAVAGPLVAREE
jgi:NADH-quinone oxidoreductase subunit M